MTRDIDSPDYRDSNVGEGMIPPRKFPNAKPRAGEHTKGPWRVDDDFLSPLEWYADALICADGKFLAAAVTSPDGYKLVEAKANARRIVACVNACEGIENDWLEANAGMLQGHDHALERERDALRGLATRLDKLSRSADAFDLSTKNGCAALANEIYVLGSTARVLIARAQS